MFDAAFQVIAVLVYSFVLLVGLGMLFLAILFVKDVSQTRNAIRRNFPVIGRFRALFEHLGEFFRQYFFAMDREELPFNRAERSWVDRASLGTDNTIAFGSTRDLRPVGTVIFVNCAYPVLDRDIAQPEPVTVGPYCPHPYTTSSLFNISALSYGAISRPATLALSNGARMAGCWLNTGEGGLSPHHLAGGADIVFQMGTAKYGVCKVPGTLSEERLRQVADHEQVRMLEIKLSQGAKPGKGGILPGVKVTEEIAAIRGIPVGQDSLSPNRHLDVDSAAELLDLIHRVRSITGKPTGFKSVIGACEWLDELFEEIWKRGVESAPDFIAVDSGDGGTGAAPMPLMDNVGLPIRESLPLMVDRLDAHSLRDRIKVIASGKLVTPAEAAWAYCAGADFVVSARGFMFALGCIQALQCNRNTCPTGITTHNKRLQRGLNPDNKAVRVNQYARQMTKEIEIIAHSCGVREPRRLRRYHCRIVTETGRSVPLDELYPNVTQTEPQAATG
ncbi:MAG: FMN-binding glutamate synthase family protein [Rhodospirillaceae bacterium]|nr:FMN-binding glutamate synthase family protein [Rhodospirillaceae bacterium]